MAKGDDIKERHRRFKINMTEKRPWKEEKAQELEFMLSSGKHNEIDYMLIYL